MATFQQRFIQAKEMTGMKWIDIAKKSGLDKASISQYKNGVHIPEQDALYKLSKVLNVSMEWLSGADVPTSNESNSLLERYQALNNEGKTEFLRLLDEISSQDRYKK